MEDSARIEEEVTVETDPEGEVTVEVEARIGMTAKDMWINLIKMTKDYIEIGPQEVMSQTEVKVEEDLGVETKTEIEANLAKLGMSKAEKYLGSIHLEEAWETDLKAEEEGNSMIETKVKMKWKALWKNSRQCYVRWKTR